MVIVWLLFSFEKKKKKRKDNSYRVLDDYVLIELGFSLSCFPSLLQPLTVLLYIYIYVYVSDQIY